MKRILILILAICLGLSCCVYAATPSATMISPDENSIIASDSLFVSIKVSDKKKVELNVYEEKIDTKTVDKDGIAILKAVEVKDLDEEKMTAIADKIAKEEYKEVSVAEPVTYTAVGENGYLTKTIKDLEPGVYKVEVKVLDKDGKAEETLVNYTILQEKPKEEAKAAAEKIEKTETVETVETVKTSLMQSLVKFVKSIIK